MIDVKVVADSIHQGNRLTTLECTFHRFILPEFNTYRQWSRSAASSRAIPLKVRIEEVINNPAIPYEWGKNKAGMVADEILDPKIQLECESVWREAAAASVDYATYLEKLQVHKQVAARILEPFLWHTSVVSSTDWDNMFSQRIHKDAQPEFRVLAEKMKKALDNSEPEPLTFNQWHLPYIREDEKCISLEVQRKISVARVARTSYLNQDKSEISKDLSLYHRLITANPPHLAPFEMVARPVFSSKDPVANFTGWTQLRHLLEKSENV